jgi:phenylpyruvate tautomerase PptA (4-oxalocrotonate tautomerase family)
MPILDVEIILRRDETLREQLATELAHVAGEVFGAPAGTTWVKVKGIPRTHYAENGDGPPSGVYPVFVSILKRRLPSPAEMRAEAVRLTSLIAGVCGRPPENVHLMYLPEGAGRVFFGGQPVSG